MLKEFKPALFFLLKFLAIYFIGNILYGLWIESYGNNPDAATQWITSQSAALLRLTGFDTIAQTNPEGPTVWLKQYGKVILNVFEGCNGINVMIVFVAFLIAFGGPGRALAWFLPLGLVVIHLGNLSRIWLLYYTAIYRQEYFYYFHKYFFTAVLYLIVFTLWVIWVVKFNRKKVDQ